MKHFPIILLSLSTNYLSIIINIDCLAVNSRSSPTRSSTSLTAKCPQSILDSYDQDMARLMTIGQRIWPESFQESKTFCV